MPICRQNYLPARPFEVSVGLNVQSSLLFCFASFRSLVRSRRDASDSTRSRKEARLLRECISFDFDDIVGLKDLPDTLKV